MRIQEMDIREMGMSGKEQERTGKPSEAFYRVEKEGVKFSVSMGKILL